MIILNVDKAIVLPFKIMLDERRQLHIPGRMHVGIAHFVGPLIIAVTLRAGKNISKMVITGRTSHLLYRRSRAYTE